MFIALFNLCGMGYMYLVFGQGVNLLYRFSTWASRCLRLPSLSKPVSDILVLNISLMNVNDSTYYTCYVIYAYDYERRFILCHSNNNSYDTLAIFLVPATGTKLNMFNPAEATSACSN